MDELRKAITPMPDFEIAQVIPAPPGWRWCRVSVGQDDEPIWFDFASVGVFALYRERAVSAARGSTTVVAPLFTDFEGWQELVPPWAWASLTDTIDGFLVDPLWDDARLYHEIAATVASIRRRTPERRSDPTSAG